MNNNKQVLFVRFCVASAELTLVNLTSEQKICLYQECSKMSDYFGDIDLKIQIYFKLEYILNESEKILFLKDVLATASQQGNEDAEIEVCFLLCVLYYKLQKYSDALVYGMKLLEIARKIDSKVDQLRAYFILGKVYHSTNQYDMAIVYGKKCTGIAQDTGDKENETEMHLLLGHSYLSIKQFDDAILCSQKCIDMAKKTYDKVTEMHAYLVMGNAHLFLNRLNDAILYSKKCIDVAKAVGDKEVERKAYLISGNAYNLLNQQENAIYYIKKGIDITLKSNNGILSLMSAYLVLGNACHSLERHDDAILYCKKCIDIAEQVGDKQVEMKAYSLSGHSFFALEQNENGIFYSKKWCEIANETGNNEDEMYACLVLGKGCIRLEQFDDAIVYCKKCISIAKKTDDRSKKQEMYARLTLGEIYISKMLYDDAFRNCKTCFEIAKETRDKAIEKEAHLLIGRTCQSFCKYDMDSMLAIDFKRCSDVRKAAFGKLKIEVNGDILSRINDLIWHLNIGMKIAVEINDSLEKIEPFEYSLNSIINYIFEIGYSQNLKSLLAESNGDDECYKTLEKIITTNDTNNIMRMICFLILSHYHESQAQLERAIGCFQEVIMNLEPQYLKYFVNAHCYLRMADSFLKLNQYSKCLDHLRLGLADAKQCYYKCPEFILSCRLGKFYFVSGQIDEAKHFLSEAVRYSDYLIDDRHFDERMAITIFDGVVLCRKDLLEVLIKTNQIKEAFLVLDQCRARELKQQLKLKYRIKGEVTGKGHITYSDVEILLSSNKYSMICYSVCDNNLHTFVAESRKELQYSSRCLNKCEEHLMMLLQRSFDEIQVRQSISCENRSLDMTAQEVKVSRKNKDDDHEDIFRKGTIKNAVAEEDPSDLRGQENESPDKSNFTSALEVLYQELQGQVSIKNDEIVIIPDGPLLSVPYSALRDPATGRYLAETKRIRIAPSITTLNILQQCPEGHHNMKGALIIGDPFVGEVMYLGERKVFPALPFAAAEAKIIANILGVKPMTGRQATKSTVIEALKQETAIIHIAAHGSLENATIALSPSTSKTTEKDIPGEEDYMLTMADVQKSQVRAQLVVLSCCHSGRGEIRAEGVVGMCRAFLVSGARAVVGSLWAISDDATLEFMSRFYSHLKNGKSASTSLQQTMKDTSQSYEYSEPKYWAPFFLIGDDVTIYCKEG